MTTYIWPQGGDSRFAPKYLVGNVLAGDSNVAGSANGFYYIPDPGDGSGIALALSYADPTSPDFIGAGDVWIRPGYYERTVATPLVIPAYVRVMGAGVSTIVRIKGRTLDGGIFVLSDENAVLRDLEVQANPTAGGTATAAILVTGNRASVENVRVYNPSVNVPNAIQLDNVAGANVSNCYIESHLFGIRVNASRSAILGNRLVMNAATATSGIIAEATSLRCVIANNLIDNLGGSAAAIDNAADYCTITSNEVEVTNPVPGITVSGDNNVVVANVTGAATPVTNTGAGNEVAHNI